MTVGDLKDRIDKLDDDQMVVISDEISWCNIEKIEIKGREVHIVQETSPIFSES